MGITHRLYLALCGTMWGGRGVVESSFVEKERMLLKYLRKMFFKWGHLSFGH